MKLYHLNTSFLTFLQDEETFTILMEILRKFLLDKDTILHKVRKRKNIINQNNFHYLFYLKQFEK